MSIKIGNEVLAKAKVVKITDKRVVLICGTSRFGVAKEDIVIPEKTTEIKPEIKIEPKSKRKTKKD